MTQNILEIEFLFDCGSIKKYVFFDWATMKQEDRGMEVARRTIKVGRRQDYGDQDKQID